MIRDPACALLGGAQKVLKRRQVILNCLKVDSRDVMGIALLGRGALAIAAAAFPGMTGGDGDDMFLTPAIITRPGRIHQARIRGNDTPQEWFVV